jgi:N-acyl amino acid synthase of PEP-CTERM/exosortase system
MPLQRFEFKKITREDPLFKEVLALRYKVYCEERGFENPDDHPDGLERDTFDEAAVHFAAIDRPTGRVVGTVRLVLESAKNFPGEQLFDLDSIAAGLCREKIGEVSRLALAKWYCQEVRRRLRRGAEAGEIVLGLFRCLALESGRLGLTHLCAVMSRGLPVLLAKNQINFERIGPEQNYHGFRAPYFGSIENIAGRNSDLYDIYKDPLPVARVA